MFVFFSFAGCVCFSFLAFLCENLLHSAFTPSPFSVIGNLEKKNKKKLKNGGSARQPANPFGCGMSSIIQPIFR